MITQSYKYFYKRFLQHVAFFSSKFAFFFLIFTLNTIPARDFCNMLHFSLLKFPFPPNIHHQHHSYKRFLQHVALFSSKLASQRETRRQNAKAPEAGKPASGAIKLKCQNELLYFSKLSQSSKKSYMFTVRIPYSS